jgi:hypothetical protein
MGKIRVVGVIQNFNQKWIKYKKTTIIVIGNKFLFPQSETWKKKKISF